MPPLPLPSPLSPLPPSLPPSPPAQLGLSLEAAPQHRAIKLNLILLFSSFIPLLRRSPEKNETTKMIDRADGRRNGRPHCFIDNSSALQHTSYTAHSPFLSCLTLRRILGFLLFLRFLLRDGIPRGNFHLISEPSLQASNSFPFPDLARLSSALKSLPDNPAHVPMLAACVILLDFFALCLIFTQKATHLFDLGLNNSLMALCLPPSIPRTLGKCLWGPPFLFAVHSFRISGCVQFWGAQ